MCLLKLSLLTQKRSPMYLNVLLNWSALVISPFIVLIINSFSYVWRKRSANNGALFVPIGIHVCMRRQAQHKDEDHSRNLNSVPHGPSNNYESVFSLLHPCRFLHMPPLFGEYIVFTEINKGRYATGVISLLVVVIKNQQMEYIQQNRTNHRIKFD